MAAPSSRPLDAWKEISESHTQYWALELRRDGVAPGRKITFSRGERGLLREVFHDFSMIIPICPESRGEVLTDFDCWEVRWVILELTG